MIQKKICLIGSFAVGKTSLVARFAKSIFSDKYHTTVGVKVDKKTVAVDGTDVALMIWDLAGDDCFGSLQLSYLRGSAGYLLVADGTRRLTLDTAVALQQRIEEMLGILPFVLLVNKADLLPEWEIADADLEPLAARGWRVLRTSAKTDECVEQAFAQLAAAMLAPESSERLFEQLLARDGVLVLERERARIFRACGTVPDWLARSREPGELALALREPGQVFPFLEHFIDDAEHWWRRSSAGELRSEPWTESTAAGDELHLEARARAVEGKAYLLVQNIGAEFERTHRVLQAARELALAHERLMAETSKKEILLHCIVHDLNGPLGGVCGAFDILKKEKLSATGQKFLALGRHAARQQSNFISDMLDTFRAEVCSLETLASNPAASPDGVATARSVMEALAPACEIRNMAIRLVLAPGTPDPFLVIGERNRLERIFYNLLQNALRYSPRGAQITITIAREESEAFITVDDCGPGIPPGIGPQLFQKFVRGEGQSGKAGLGLYFCRITVEQWGGTIGCEASAEGGTRFWFRLKAA